jgi:hypothetical protein
VYFANNYFVILIVGPAGCPYDSLTVYQGNDTMGGQVGKFCGTTVPQVLLAIVSKGGGGPPSAQCNFFKYPPSLT